MVLHGVSSCFKALLLYNGDAGNSLVSSYACVCMHVHVHVHVHACTYAYTHAYAHAYARAYICVCIQPLSPP